MVADLKQFEDQDDQPRHQHTEGEARDLIANVLPIHRHNVCYDNAMRAIILAAVGIVLVSQAAQAEDILRIYPGGNCPCNDASFVAKLKEQRIFCTCAVGVGLGDMPPAGFLEQPWPASKIIPPKRLLIDPGYRG